MDSKGQITAYVALGSNMGNRCSSIMRSLNMLDDASKVSVMMVSQLIETAPDGVPDNQGAYLNGAAELRTLLTAQELLGLMLDIEHKLGRRRRVHWEPRVIDLDLLLFGDEVIDLPQLKVPHPLMHNRLFVMAPLAEIASGAMHPVLNRSIKDIYDALSRESESQCNYGGG